MLSQRAVLQDCQPLCSRWTYPVFSASYSSIQYQKREVEMGQLANRSWGRITVTMPQSSRSRRHEPKPSAYLPLCKIGAVMSAYAGFSMITFAEILAYGLYVCYEVVKLKRARARVSPEADRA